MFERFGKASTLKLLHTPAPHNGGDMAEEGSAALAQHLVTRMINQTRHNTCTPEINTGSSKVRPASTQSVVGLH